MYRFTARSSAPIQYLDSDAKRLLKIVGKEPTAPGIITKAQTAGAIQAIEAAIAQEEALQSESQPRAEEEAREDQDAPSGQAPVPLRNRALPLLQLLRTAVGEEEDVVWEAV